jgi:uncharacterized protein
MTLPVRGDRPALLLLLLLLALPAHAAEVPYLSGRVNDLAGVLSNTAASELELLLKAHEDSTSNQVAVLTIPSLEGEPLEEYSLRVAEAWKLGVKGRDNGVLLLIAREERKVRIEVGSGLEGALPDAVCGQIIRNEIVPRFRRDDYDGGVRAGAEAILKAIRGEYVAGEEGEQPELGVAIIGGLVFFCVVGLFTLIALFSKGCLSWFLYLFLIPFWFGFPAAMFGPGPGSATLATYLLGFLLVKFWLRKTPHGKAWGSQIEKAMGPGALGSSGGSPWSGGSSGGGFSGGGGGFSGGGASGSW